MPVPRIILGILAVLLSMTVVAEAGKKKEKTQKETEYIRVVQSKVFLRRGRVEISPTFGLNLNDSLQRYVFMGLRFSYHISDYFAIGANFAYAAESKAGQQEYLLGDTGLKTQVDPVKYMFELSGYYVPVYGKFALFNRTIVHWDGYLTIGLGATKTEGNVLFSGSLGIGWRIYLTRFLTMNFEFRDYLYRESILNQKNFINNFVFHLGISIFLPARYKL